MKRTILIVLGVLICTALSAQIRVTGKVTDSGDGTPVSYAHVYVKGNTSIATSTDDLGQYTLERVPSDAILVFTFIGYENLELPVNGRSVINASMRTDAFSLDEVIMVAYGTAKKGTYTGAATVVKQEAIKDVPTLSFENAINGKIAGLTVSTQSGQAGATSAIRIRGTGSMNASNNPLFVVDGVPVISGDVGQLGSTMYSSSNVMSTINPTDIESLTVLKDAAASALYGSRAANGVILITTKRGKSGKPTINFKASVGISPSFATVNYDIAPVEQQVEMLYEIFWNEKMWGSKYEYGKNSTPEAASKYALGRLDSRFNKHGYTFIAPDHTQQSLQIVGLTDGVENRDGKYYDWDALLFRTGVYQTYDLSASGGTDNSNYYSSFSYTKQAGMSVENNFSRITGRINLNQKINNFIELGSNVNIAFTDKVGFNDTWNLSSNYFLQSRNLLWGLYWPTDYKTGNPYTARYGSYAYNYDYYRNEQENSSKVLRLSAIETLTIHLLPNLNIRSIFSFDNSSSREFLYYSKNHYSGVANSGSAANYHTNYRKTVSSTTLNYNKDFAEKHNITFLAGFEIESNKTDYQRSTGKNLASGALNTPATGGETDATAYYWGYNLVSILSRLEYNYDNKYYVSGSFRRDGSSRLGINNRWGNFWSAAFSWRVSNEDFMKDISWLSDLRLRASYGSNGTLPSSNYGHLALASYSSKYMNEPGGGIANVPNPDLKWEENLIGNIALEFGLFDNRLRGLVEVYDRTSKNLLQNVPISRVTGFSSTLANVGETNNRGVEIELSGDIIRNNNFRWDVGLTATFGKSRVTKLYGSDPNKPGEPIVWSEGVDGNASYIWKEGESMYSFWGREWAGVERETGRDMWYINDPDGTVKPDVVVNGRDAVYEVNYAKAKETIIGTAEPKVYGGLNTSLEWKGLTLGLNFLYKIGGHIYDAASKENNDGGYFWERTMSQYAYDNRWTPENKDAKYGMRIGVDWTDVRGMNSRNLDKADFFRLKSVTLAYNLPKSVVNKIKLSNVRVFFNGDNLLTWAANGKYDPEVSVLSIRAWDMPIAKTFTFGLELTF